VDDGGRIPCVGRGRQCSSCKGSCNEPRNTTTTYEVWASKRNGETPEIGMIRVLPASAAGAGSNPAGGATSEQLIYCEEDNFWPDLPGRCSSAT
jgi:hypothetical protein